MHLRSIHVVTSRPCTVVILHAIYMFHNWRKYNHTVMFNISILYLGTAILVCRYKFLPVVYGCETLSFTLREELD